MTPPTSDLGAETSDPAELSYEEARAGLAEVVGQLQSGTPTLEEALDLWERGELLARRCEEVLAAARQRIEQVTGDPAGAPTRAG